MPNLHSLHPHDTNRVETVQVSVEPVQFGVVDKEDFEVCMTRLPRNLGHARALGLAVIRVYMSNSFSSRSVSFRNRRPM